MAFSYSNAEHSVIWDDSQRMSIPCVAGNTDFDKIKEAGTAIADYLPPAPTWADIRSERDSLLAETDWWAVSDRAMSADETNYRQALRDVPQNFASPADVVWPTKPA